jgi:hypothetical protein
VNTVQIQPQSVAVAEPQEARSRISSNWRWVLYATAGVALVLALKYLNVQELLKAALEWIGNLGPWGPVIFVGLYVLATVLFVPGSVLAFDVARVTSQPPMGVRKFVSLHADKFGGLRTVNAKI